MDLSDICAHMQLIKVTNLDGGGEASSIYHCQLCKQLLTVTIKPYEVAVRNLDPQGET